MADVGSESGLEMMTDVEGRGRCHPFPTGRVRASSQRYRYFRLRDGGIISLSRNALQQLTDEWEKSLEGKNGSDRTTDASPFHHLRLCPPVIGHSEDEYARAQGKSCMGGIWCPERAPPRWEIILAARAPSRPGRPSAPETAPIGWDWRRLGRRGCLTSPHAATLLPAAARRRIRRGPAVDQSHLGPAASIACLLRSVRCGRYFWHGGGASRSFEARSVRCFSLSVRRIRRGARPERWRL
jgi:hypothetical protein